MRIRFALLLVLTVVAVSACAGMSNLKGEVVDAGSVVYPWGPGESLRIDLAGYSYRRGTLGTYKEWGASVHGMTFSDGDKSAATFIATKGTPIDELKKDRSYNHIGQAAFCNGLVRAEVFATAHSVSMPMVVYMIEPAGGEQIGVYFFGLRGVWARDNAKDAAEYLRVHAESVLRVCVVPAATH